jgi:predicted Zn-dependent protease
MALTKEQKLHDMLQTAIDAYHARRIDAAIHHLSEGASAFSKSARLWGYLGFLYAEARQDGKAAQAFRKSTRLSPRSETASLGLFHSLWRTGNTDAAFNEMRRFVKLSDSPQYRELLRGMLADSANQSRGQKEAAVA